MTDQERDAIRASIRARVEANRAKQAAIVARFRAGEPEQVVADEGDDFDGDPACMRCGNDASVSAGGTPIPCGPWQRGDPCTAADHRSLCVRCAEQATLPELPPPPPVPSIMRGTDAKALLELRAHREMRQRYGELLRRRGDHGD